MLPCWGQTGALLYQMRVHGGDSGIWENVAYHVETLSTAKYFNTEKKKDFLTKKTTWVICSESRNCDIYLCFKALQ